MNALAILNTNLSDLLTLPDVEAAETLNRRICILDEVARVYERSFGERAIIIRCFEERKLWRYLIDPNTNQPFPHLTAWLSCNSFLGCRRTNFEAMRTSHMLSDVPSDKLIDIPKSNLHMLASLSTEVRNDPEVLEAAKRLARDKFEEKLQKDHPNQHIESRKPLRFSPGRTGARIVEDGIAMAISMGYASTRDEALVRAFETAVHEWELELELASMPVEEECK